MTENAGQLTGLYKEDVEHLLHPVTQLKNHFQQGPRILEKGEGIYVFDLDGKRYIDGLSGLWNVCIGHHRPEMAKAIQEQVEKLAFSPTFFGFSNIPAIKLADKLAGIVPDGLTKVHFTSGGAETNETNLKLARYYHKLIGKPNKTKIISRRKAYHGISMGAMSATGIETYWKMFEPMAPDFLHIAPPYCYRCELHLTYPSCNLACARQLQEVIDREGRDTVAAFIGELILGAGGVIVPPDDYWPLIQDICLREEVLLIIDEVITGFGRTGKWFCCEHYGLEPQMFSLAKAITSGYLPLGAAMIKDEIYSAMLERTPTGMPFMHGFTYSGHPVVCAASLCNLGIMEREDLVGNAARTGAYFQERLKELAHLPIVGEVRGKGLIAAVELVSDKSNRDPFTPPGSGGAAVAQRAYEMGMICRAAGDILALSPPLIITKQQVDDMVEILRQAIEDTVRELKK
ncbi:MAG: aspartate aminotransferase family protein [Deltaproteobacteria bacterium]|nr:aspartate aminotransferase family protein [Deltaproteobacteria bacterium]